MPYRFNKAPCIQPFTGLSAEVGFKPVGEHPRTTGARSTTSLPRVDGGVWRLKRMPGRD